MAIDPIVLDQRAGDDFGWSGVVTLPTAAWSVEVDLYEEHKSTPIANDGGVVATLTPIGVNTDDDSKTDYAFVLEAPRADTAHWPASSLAEPVNLVLKPRFVGPKAKSTRNWIRIRVVR